MAHPFEGIFLEALKKSTAFDNVVLEKAEELIAKGYREAEVIGVLKTLRDGLIDTTEREIVGEAYAEIGDPDEND